MTNPRNVVELTVRQLNEEFASKLFRKAVLTKGASGYSLSLLTPTEAFPVLTKYAGDLKTWSRIDSAMAFIRKTYPAVTTINVKIGTGATQ